MDEREDCEVPPLVLQERALLAMPGFKVNAATEHIKRIHGLFKGNLNGLQRYLEEMQNPSVSLPILDVRRPDLHDAFLSQCERLNS